MVRVGGQLPHWPPVGHVATVSPAARGNEPMSTDLPISSRVVLCCSHGRRRALGSGILHRVSDRIVLRSRWLVAFCWIAAVGFLVLSGAVTASGPGPDPGPIDYIGTAAFGIVVSLVFLRAARMRVELDDRGITVFGLFTTKFLPWSELAGVSADYGGLRLIRTDGTVVTAGSMGKPNWATWLHREAPADGWVAVITYQLSKHRPNTGA